jgi:hypothetical protein
MVAAPTAGGGGLLGGGRAVGKQMAASLTSAAPGGSCLRPAFQAWELQQMEESRTQLGGKSSSQ